MLRVDLDRQLTNLQEEITLLANVVDKAIYRAVEALKGPGFDRVPSGD